VDQQLEGVDCTQQILELSCPKRADGEVCCEDDFDDSAHFFEFCLGLFLGFSQLRWDFSDELSVVFLDQSSI